MIAKDPATTSHALRPPSGKSDATIVAGDDEASRGIPSFGAGAMIGIAVG